MSIRLITLGTPGCETAGQAAELPAQKARFALLVYLAVERNTSRDEVAAVFWPEKDDDHARHALSQSIYELKRLLGDGWLESHGGRLTVPNSVTVDADEFSAACEKGDYEHAVGLYRGPFLSGFFLPNCKAFESWVDRRRAQLERLHRRARRECVDQLVAADRLTDALEVARRWVELDPFEDEANHRLIELLAQSGRRSEALYAFNSYEARLRDELAIEPLDNTKELVTTIRQETRAPAPDAASPATRMASATVPITAESGEEALGGTIIGELSRRRVFRMAAWYGAATYGGLQFTQIMKEALYLPPWILSTMAILAIAGFPLAVVLSWQFDLTSQGVRRAHHGIVRGRAWRLIAVAFLLIVAAAAAAMLFPVRRSLLAFGPAPELTCDDGSAPPCRQAVAIHSDVIAILPLQRQRNTVGPIPDLPYTTLVTDALALWNDFDIADARAVEEKLESLPADIRMAMPLDTAYSIARSVGAGKLITGTIRADGDTLIVVASLYDVAAKRPLEHATARFAAQGADHRSVIHRLARSLVLRHSGLHLGADEATGSVSYDALSYVDSANNAVNRRDLEAAKRYFRIALELDPTYAYAHLELAHVLLWQDSTGAEWARHAEVAAMRADRLYGHDKLLAAAIAALAGRRFREACSLYREVLRRNERSFDGWYGLSECLARDPTVVRDTSSPSGWSFAASHHEAIRAHMRALELLPSFTGSFRNLTSSRLASLLYTRSSKLRLGVAVDSDTLHFGAYAALAADTLSLVPYPMAEIANRPVPVGNLEVVERQRGQLRDAALAWARASRNSPRALEALATSLELSGAVGPARTINQSALAAIRRARELEPDGSNAVRYRTAEVRMLLKAGMFREARRAARATLRAYQHPEPAEARRLAGVAGLIGLPHTMADLLLQAAPVFQSDQPVSGEPVDVPGVLARASSRLLAYAYCGVPIDSIRLLTARAHQVLDDFVSREDRELMHAATLDRAAMISFPLLGADDVHRAGRPVSPHIQTQRLIARGETAGARRELLRLDSMQIGALATEIAADGMLIEAQLQLAVGDEPAARRTLDEYLNALRDISAVQYNQPYQPVAIVRMMALRAELAARSGERATARKWARAVVDLWQDGSGEVQPTVKRMRKLARL